MTILGFFPAPVRAKQQPDDEAAETNRKASEPVESCRCDLPWLGPMNPWQTPNGLQDRPELVSLVMKARQIVGGAHQLRGPVRKIRGTTAPPPG